MSVSKVHCKEYNDEEIYQIIQNGVTEVVTEVVKKVVKEFIMELCDNSYASEYLKDIENRSYPTSTFQATASPSDATDDSVNNSAFDSIKSLGYQLKKAKL